MESYCLGFLFSEDKRRIVLMRKLKPEFQKGRLNGVGGKVGPKETPTQAMVREFNEETGLETIERDWTLFARFFAPEKYEVYCFHTWGKVDGCSTMEEEPILILKVGDVLAGVCDPSMGNLKWLIQMALSNWSGEDRCVLYGVEERVWRP